MRLRLDVVQGTVLDTMVKVGRYTRMGIVSSIPVNFSTPSNDVLIRALAVSGLPQKGDRLTSYAPYDKYFLKRHIVRPFDATTCLIEMWYDYNGVLRVRDSSQLSSVPSQINPQTKNALYVTYQPPGGGKPIKKLATLVSPLPMRQLVFSQTVDFMASPAVLECLGGVNHQAWQGLPKGYWLCSGLDASTDDEGITYDYTATFTTKQVEDWSQYAFMTDDTGQAVEIPQANITTMRNAEYSAGETSDPKGILKVGMFSERDFLTTFGV